MGERVRAPLNGPRRRPAPILAVVALAACATGPSSELPVPRGAVYRPGQSIESARLCECRECADRGCCAGEPERNDDAQPELGLTLSACGRCARRVWTARGLGSCSRTAPPECCPGTSSE